jgi:hypothetical protein
MVTAFTQLNSDTFKQALNQVSELSRQDPEAGLVSALEVVQDFNLMLLDVYRSRLHNGWVAPAVQSRTLSAISAVEKAIDGTGRSLIRAKKLLARRGT